MPSKLREPQLVVVATFEHYAAVAAAIVDVLRAVFCAVPLRLVNGGDRFLPFVVVRLTKAENSAVEGLEILEDGLLMPLIAVLAPRCFPTGSVDRAVLGVEFDEVESRVEVLAVFVNIQPRLCYLNLKQPVPEDYSTERGNKNRMALDHSISNTMERNFVYCNNLCVR